MTEFGKVDITDPQSPVVLSEVSAVPERFWLESPNWRAICADPAGVLPDGRGDAYSGLAWWPHIGTPPTVNAWERLGAVSRALNAGLMQFDLSWGVKNRPRVDWNAELIAAMKSHASARIMALNPDWRPDNVDTEQRNALGRASRLQRREARGEASQDEIAELDALEAVFDAIEAIRAALATEAAKVVGASDHQAAKVVHDAWLAT